MSLAQLVEFAPLLRLSIFPCSSMSRLEFVELSLKGLVRLLVSVQIGLYASFGRLQLGDMREGIFVLYTCGC